MRSLVAAIATTSLLGGCGLHERIDTAACEGYGYKYGSQAWAQCMERRDEHRKAVGVALIGAGAGMMASQPTYSAPAPAAPMQVYCTRNGLTGLSNCTAQ